MKARHRWGLLVVAAMLLPSFGGCRCPSEKGGGGSSGGSGREGSSSGDRVSVRVEVDTSKPDGRGWDVGGGAPDIALCVESDAGMRCYPSGTSVTDVRAACRDSFSCTFDDVHLPEGDVRFVVVDVDLSEHDYIGRGPCERGETCRIDAAVISVE